jgi:serine/threonine-protein kinase
MRLQKGLHIGPYVAERPLGEGGMACVWRAWDARHRQYVALKIVLDPGPAGGNFEARFLDEARRHTRLLHPNIITVREVFSFGGLPCLVMDLAEGGSLEDLLAASPQRRIDFDVACPLIIHVLAGLDYAHRQGIVHRDVKPANVLLDATHTHAWVADFGIALALGEKRRTRAGLSVGTSAYMSPEQIRATDAIDFRTDVYSVGCVLYQALTGQPPFVLPHAEQMSENAARAGVLAMHLKDSPIAPRRRMRSIPPHISDLVMRALEKNPANRIPGCAEFSRLLARPPDWRSRLRAWLG